MKKKEYIYKKSLLLSKLSAPPLFSRSPWLVIVDAIALQLLQCISKKQEGHLHMNRLNYMYYLA